ncbi:hypothetical protein [Arthrobacter sp. Leaf137]|uniref:hypothetical protein n=1 Tax=Arthrobacter sp. Leaf137 TaxID=1736271 RepID=UPI000700EE27|nr:hypothetical protein [Arthrobacter sp. Leaf137]KQQ90784.1 hypothetical protein ASF64_02230 [Arthrobacter sp. Leaf137]
MDFTRQPFEPLYAGQEVALHFQLEAWETPGKYAFQVLDEGNKRVPFGGSKSGLVIHTMNYGQEFEPVLLLTNAGKYRVQVRPYAASRKLATGWSSLDRISVKEPEPAPVVKVALEANAVPSSVNGVLWQFIEDVSKSLTFKNFATFVSKNPGGFNAKPPYGARTYQSLHSLSRTFVTQTATGQSYSSARSWTPGSDTSAAVARSYVSDQDEDLARPFPKGIPDGQYPLDYVPFVELIYVYWLEEGMLFQSLNRIIARFQNRRAQPGGDPLSRLAVSPLLPLRGLLWGLAEAEKDRLSLRHRAAEYEYQYGLQLIGRAIPPADSLVERRTQFLDAFHSLLNACHHYYKEFSDKTVDADAFPLLSNLQELHLVLAAGANNQFADVSLSARIETLDVQWMLAQPEMREFLGGRTMVPYQEEWMGRVDTMKLMQEWSDASVTHFYDLAVHGEQLLLSVRHGRWNESGMSSDDAKNWALKWKPSVQRYIHAYRAVTGVDLSERVDTTMPSALLQRRLARKLVRY